MSDDTIKWSSFSNHLKCILCLSIKLQQNGFSINSNILIVVHRCESTLLPVILEQEYSALGEQMSITEISIIISIKMLVSLQQLETQQCALCLKKSLKEKWFLLLFLFCSFLSYVFVPT